MIASPGAIACGPDGTDFCPSGTVCDSLSDGVCPQQSRGSGTACCKPPPPKPDTTCCCDFGQDQYWHCVNGKMPDKPNALCYVPWPDCCSQQWTKCQ